GVHSRNSNCPTSVGLSHSVECRTMPYRSCGSCHPFVEHRSIRHSHKLPVPERSMQQQAGITFYRSARRVAARDRLVGSLLVTPATSGHLAIVCLTRSKSFSTVPGNASVRAFVESRRSLW